MSDQYVTTGAAWFTLSLINAGLAQGKGRSGLNWWLISLFVGPLATLLIVAWPRVVEGEPEAPADKMTTRQAVLIGVGILAIAIVLYAGVLLAGTNTR